MLQRAVSQMQDVKGDVALLLGTAVRLLTDDAERVRSEGQALKAELDTWRTRAIEAEKQSAVQEHDLDALRAGRRLRDAIGALGGVLIGVGGSGVRQAATVEDFILTGVGLALIVAAWVFIPPGQR